MVTPLIGVVGFLETCVGYRWPVLYSLSRSYMAYNTGNHHPTFCPYTLLPPYLLCPPILPSSLTLCLSLPLTFWSNPQRLQIVENQSLYTAKRPTFMGLALVLLSWRLMSTGREWVCIPAD